MVQTYDEGRLRVLRRLRLDSYTRREVSYRSAGLTVTGVLHVPDGRGPFPAIVLAHGYIEPSVYVTGQGLAREQDYSPAPATSSCTSTPAATPGRTRAGGSTARPGSATPRT